MDVAELDAVVRNLVSRNMPSVKVVKVTYEEAFDSEGDESIFIRVLMHKRPPKAYSKYAEVVDQLRTWLAGKGDNRFPYVEFVSEQDEKELQRADA
jgi:hypothetical protein